VAFHKFEHPVHGKKTSFHFSETDRDDHFKFVMKHDMGKKWLIYFLTYHTSSFKVLNCNIDCEIISNTISYKVKRKDYDS